jgi:predicted RND superfamily exporter protein
LALGQELTVKILNTEIQSFSLAFILIFITIMLALRSWRIAMAAIPPNVFPVIVITGTMSYAGINLDVQTCTIASIVIAMAVDDTIHFLHFFREELKRRNGDYRESLKATVSVVGQPIVYTSLVLAAGFWVLIFSSYVPLANFGFLSGLAVMAALVGDLILLPALLMWWKPIQVGSSEIAEKKGNIPAEG